MSMGADDYITKPVKYTDLIRAIEVRLQKTEAVISHLSQKLKLTDNEELTIRRAELTGLLETNLRLREESADRTAISQNIKSDSG
jgi:DNA-binding response OmpR family regulator